MFSFNRLIYLKPQATYTLQSFNESDGVQLLMINARQEQHQIPCLLISAYSEQYLIYFHGNAEDLQKIINKYYRGSSYDFANQISISLNVNVIIMEYPGYGCYINGKPNQQQVERDSESLLMYLVLDRRIPIQNIIIFGRSIGTGPACFLASRYEPKALILLSPFTTIREVAWNHVSFLSYLLKDQFNNLERAQQISCPCLIIHGRQDKLIPYQHSQNIYMNLSSKRKTFTYPSDKEHNDINFIDDINQPISEFIQELDKLNRLQYNIQQQ